MKYQRTLEHINELHKTGELKLETKVCHINPDPENPVDARAISNQHYVNCRWQIICNIMNEALET